MLWHMKGSPHTLALFDQTKIKLRVFSLLLSLFRADPTMQCTKTLIVYLFCSKVQSFGKSANNCSTELMTQYAQRRPQYKILSFYITWDV